MTQSNLCNLGDYRWSLMSAHALNDSQSGFSIYNSEELNQAITANISFALDYCVRDINFCYVLLPFGDSKHLVGPLHITSEGPEITLVEDKIGLSYSISTVNYYRVILFEDFYFCCQCCVSWQACAKSSIMSLKRKSRQVNDRKEVEMTTTVLELSVTVGYVGADVKKDEIQNLHRLMQDHCLSGVVSLERGDKRTYLISNVFFCARAKSVRSFANLVKKYMGWLMRST